ncbi:MAG: HDOD domain-containing protein [Verrucomicrobia bacterium]|jgi:putative nucleotidyltransferase with HDIG domain|nr:HDOD domain-containing protein [Verrucomicrobiota bacterium]
MDALDALINKVGYLPPLPQQVPQMLELLRKDEVDSDQVVTLIAHDPSLTANVMRLCNSVMFGAATPATDLHEAVLRLGFREVCQLVLVISTASTLMPPQKAYGLEASELWKHSVATALAAKTIATDLGDDANMAFTAGLLHDVGKVILARALEDTYATLLSDVEQTMIPMVEAEKKLLGFQHAEVGGRMLARWKFSAPLVAGVWFHHDPIKAHPHERLAAYVFLGNMIAYFMGHGYGHLAFAFRGRAEALEILNIQPEALPHYMLQTFEALEDVKGLLNFGSAST